jgi:hypothetical protein
MFAKRVVLLWLIFVTLLILLEVSAREIDPNKVQSTAIFSSPANKKKCATDFVFFMGKCRQNFFKKVFGECIKYNIQLLNVIYVTKEDILKCFTFCILSFYLSEFCAKRLLFR